MSDASPPARPERILFVTGRLAETIVRSVVADVASRMSVKAEVRVLGISVAALMHARWLDRRLDVNAKDYDRVIVPGWCQGDLDELSERRGIPFERGPKDVFDLPRYFGLEQTDRPRLDAYDIEILAEINHAPRLTDSEILQTARRYRSDGADVIDIGCIPGESWSRAGEVVRALRSEGIRVSIDSFDRHEVEQAVEAGAELVLSCNSSNRSWAASLPAELVVIPDDPSDLATMNSTADYVAEAGGRYRLDPILEPVGFAFTRSLARYIEVRRAHPDTPMMMGIGNVTEMSEIDSHGMNFLLAACCQDLRIQSVLTTEVAPWCQSAVREFDLARRLTKHAADNGVLVKHLEVPSLLLRDRKVTRLSPDELHDIASRLTDPNVRIFVSGDQLHLMNREGYWSGDDPFELFRQLLSASPGIDAPHAFYLGYEMAKAFTALTLGKQYRQDQPLDWGFLSRPEHTGQHADE